MLALTELLKDWPCLVKGGSVRVEVKGITERSDEVQPGYMFVAREGKKSDGLGYIDDAIERGAVCIVTDRMTDLKQKDQVAYVFVADCLQFLSHACARFEGNPSDDLTVIAVTGTNGKTTVTHFIDQLLRSIGVKSAVIGTLGLVIDGVNHNLPLPAMTTLPPVHLHRTLRYCRDLGITHIVMEASSLGLSQLRLDHCKIDLGLFLNLGNDHYAEHGSRLKYKKAKERLAHLASEVIVNGDDDFCASIIRKTEKPVMSFGQNPENDYTIEVLKSDRSLTEMMVQYDGTSTLFEMPVSGVHNALNAAAAISALERLGYSLQEISKHIKMLKLPEGRLQEIRGANGVHVYIDYAHTPDALQAVLKSLALICRGRILTVFGCGGDRDPGKRPEMGEIAAFYSSIVWITSDNPRSEDPQSIIHDILSGIGADTTRYFIEPDREKAIKQALGEARRGDFVLIAGKGHEKTQTFANETIHFSDHEIAAKFLEEMNEKKTVSE